ncbi:cysteine dioxygenase [Rhodococcus jostii]|uniref:cysteine dioxygenase family protein n=1 Tax=Rhodococcus jostii TaxID=132919 RepID=UPI0036281507
MIDAHKTSSPLQELTAAIRNTVGRTEGNDGIATLVANTLEPFLLRPDLLSEGQRAGDPLGYRQHILHIESDGSFSVVALVWLPGQRTPIHDHLSWCVVGVYEGEESERRYTLAEKVDGSRLIPNGRTTTNPIHTACGFAPPGDIHEVWNSSDKTTISIHVYGADISKLGSSIRRHYPRSLSETRTLTN